MQLDEPFTRNNLQMRGGDLMPCGYLDDPRQWDEPDNMTHARNVEDYTDNLMAECKVLTKSEQLVIVYEMIDTNAAIMTAIANWSGSSADAPELAKTLHVLLANGLQKIAESEVKT